MLLYVSFVLNIPTKDKSKLKKNSKQQNMCYIFEFKGLNVCHFANTCMICDYHNGGPTCKTHMVLHALRGRCFPKIKNKDIDIEKRTEHQI